MPEGYGLVCHRALKTCCEVIGIKDLHAKVEGPTNLQHIIKAFFIGLLQQVPTNYYVSFPTCIDSSTGMSYLKNQIQHKKR